MSRAVACNQDHPYVHYDLDEYPKGCPVCGLRAELLEADRETGRLARRLVELLDKPKGSTE